MLEIRKSAVSLDERDLMLMVMVMEMERIVTDGDEEGALKFIKKSIYNRSLHAQQGRLKSHFNAANPVEGFIQHNK